MIGSDRSTNNTDFTLTPATSRTPLQHRRRIAHEKLKSGHRINSRIYGTAQTFSFVRNQHQNKFGQFDNIGFILILNQSIYYAKP